ncbi:MAG: hypothetical protein GTO18_14965 [Anaerolineales bacterium]|nr:hypothetical protein [Anaerolineales bacterium]
MRRKAQFLVIALVLLGLVLVAPQLILIRHFNADIYSDIDDLPAKEYGVVFGAYVGEDQSLSDAALERIEAAVLLYQKGKVQKLFISGTNRSNRQASVLAEYAESRGVPNDDTLVDGLGIDTHDTCRHFGQIGQEGLLITQGYHLPRAMLMCERDGIEVDGLAVNHLGILPERGKSLTAIYLTRGVRFVRESLLTWSFILGIYDKVSNEAEMLE